MNSKSITQRLAEQEETLAWARSLNCTLKKLVDEGEIDRVSYQITDTIASIHWLPAILLALSSCRFSDLKKISLGDIKAGRLQLLLEGKTGELRVLENLHLGEREQDVKLNEGARLMYTNYGSLKEAIQRSTPREVRKVLKGKYDGTHIFRHLRASFMFFRGVKEEEIQRVFNHKSRKTTQHYIHGGLFPFFYN